jgi:hypothetical protein
MTGNTGTLALPRPHRSRLGDVISWAFGVATVVTNKGKEIWAERLMESPATYTHSPHWMAMGVGATGAARTAEKTNTALTTEKMTRTVGTESVSTNKYKVTGSIAATEELKVDEAGLFDQLASGGNMYTSATMNVDTLANGDSITFTWTVELS